MINPDRIFGRLGNRMFQMAFCYAYSLDNEVDFYFQDPKWFEGHEKEIKRLYSQNIPPKTDMVAIHVRRGDYVGNGFYVDLMETEYYQKAMEQFPNADFIVFSDDIEWCMKKDIFKDCEFSHGQTDLYEMNLMASCIGQIVSNSSFSWWAAYISPYTQKVIAPSKDNWYADGIERTVCPTNWIRI